jgi:hypothetical protein
MPTLNVANPHVSQAFALSSYVDVGIVLQSAYDLILRPYRGPGVAIPR